MEWLLALAVLLTVCLLTAVTAFYHLAIPDIPEKELGRLDDFNTTGQVIGYTPQTQHTKAIMDKIALQLHGTGIGIEGFEDEKTLEEMWRSSEMLWGIVFKDPFSYDIRTSSERAPMPIDHFGIFYLCLNHTEDCSTTQYWLFGFVFLQANIDAAIIEVQYHRILYWSLWTPFSTFCQLAVRGRSTKYLMVQQVALEQPYFFAEVLGCTVTTNHSVWTQLKSAVGVLLKFPESEFIDPLTTGVCIVMFSMAFFPFLYFLTLNVAREKATLKDLLCMMGLRDLSFWLSWGLLYGVYMCIMAILLAVVAKYGLLVDCSMLMLFLLFFLYGLSGISFCFLLISLLRKPKLTSIIGFLLTLTFGCLSLILLVDDLPPSVMWVLGIILSPCAFSTGMYQVVILENEKEGAHLESLTEGPYPLIGVFCILVLNAILYMLLALYFDKVLPNTYGRRHSPFFLFKSSYWFRQQRGIEAVVDNEDPSDSFTSDYIEPVPLEFRGKEAIRISNIKKTFKEEDTEVKALRGLLFEVYEGQITALLGHSGAGKTTLLNILSGLSPPTDGTVSIYQHTLSEMEDTLKYGQKMVGFCPQFNVKFDILTVKENLRLFAKVRGIPSKEVEREVQNVLNGLDIASIKDTRAVSLSGGQQRKLTLGIAILGNPQILLLDEPTAGLDPCSRHHVWNLLKERKADRVTLFSTQFMDEADILADWKAVLSAGRLKCVGSSMFLKRKWGIGYHLRMHVTETCNAEEITSVVKYHIPSAALSRQHEQEMIYTLPFDNIDSFPELFSDLDTRSGQEITNYGVSMTTLEDVFLKLEGEQAIEQADYRVFSEEHVEEERGGGAVDEMEQTLLSLSETGKATVSGAALWRQQVLAIARVRFLKLKHETKTLRSVIVLFLIFILPMAVQLSLYGLRDQFSELDLKPDLYLLHPGEAPYKRFTNLLIENDTGSEMEDFIRSVKSQNLLLDVNGSHNAEEELTHNLALRVSREGKDYRFTLMTNVRAVNGFPVLMNIISNAFLRSFNSTACIQIANRLFLEDHSKYYMIELYVFSISFMGILAAGLSPYLGISSVQDHKIRAISQLRLSGIFPSAYWCGQALVDMSVLWLLLMAMTAIMCMFNYTVQMSAWGWTALLLTITGYSASSILLVYLISFACHKGRNNPDFWACIFLLVTLGSLTVDGISFFLPVPRYVILFFLCLFVPVYPLGSMMRLESTARTLFYPRGIIEAPTLGIPILAPYIHCIVFTLILRCLEKRYGKKTFRGDPFFRIPPKNDKVSSNLDELEGDDASVQDERTRVQEVIAGQRTEEDSAIVASSLRKEYTDKKASSVFRKKKKAATRNVSFCVKKGEILGLLGPNGAGKSTTIRMLTGDTKPTAGQVLIAGVVSDATAQRQSESIGFLGYCPQENPLWPTLTVKEHLEVYAAVKGMRKEDASVAIKRVTDALELNEQLTRPARKLSEGVKRKVCFALSMLANPTVVLLDEPSTGMDPKGQQRVWRAIRAAFKNKERGAILTTHYMEEAEAVCDRVAIMASGKLRCIGSIQQLKSKFGKGYFLEIKVRDPQQVDVLHKDILKIFPLAARLERFSSLLSYKIPMENVKSLSQAFSVLEEVKRTFNLEEYSFSQSTLEQVFIELTKEQEKDNFDLALDSTFEWKQLQEEDA